MNMELRRSVVFCVACVGLSMSAAAAGTSTAIIEDNIVFAEKNGMVAVEAEHYFKQTGTDKRAFYLTTSEQNPSVQPAGDPPHVASASGGAYLEVCPIHDAPTPTKSFGARTFRRYRARWQSCITK
jgi:hypothetical protein